jgi:hypothetical protein
MIAFFGCWGDVNNGTPPYYERVIAAIKANRSITSVLVAGDNYYMSKNKENKKLKNFNQKQIDTLFDALNSIGVPVTVMYGNHEWDKYSTVSKKDSCSIVDDEKKTVEGYEEDGTVVPGKPNVSLVAYKAYALNGDVFILLDTSMFEYADSDYECYDTTDMVALRQKQLDELEKQIEGLDGKRVFIAGHHPICIFRKKKKNIILSVNVKLARAIKTLLAHFPGKEFHYLCADFHVFQEQSMMLDDIPLTMHIVGTGGAELDDVYTTPSDVLYDNKNQDGTFAAERNLAAGEDPPVIKFFEESAEPVHVQFSQRTLTATAPDITITSTFVEGGATYGYLQISDAFSFVPVISGGKRNWKTRRRSNRSWRKSRARSRRRKRFV